MKNKTLHSRPASIPKKRWAAYAAAGAATALAGSNSAEAAIHYSGLLQVHFPPDKNKTKTFQLDQTGDFFKLVHTSSNRASASEALFTMFGIGGSGFRGPVGFDIYYVSKLSFGQPISTGHFTHGAGGGYYGIMAAGFTGGGSQQWRDPGVGFIGFRFNSGAGTQYGWARVRMGGDQKNNGFRLIDFAYADPGEPITAGETGQNMSDEQGPDEGSLGGLALGAAGLLAWRKSRSRITH